MNVFDLDSEVFVGDDEEPTIDAAQEESDTQSENQDDDPEASDAEKARIWKLIGMNPGGET